MKMLRNKKTGAIGDLLGTYNAVPFIGIAIDYHDGNPVKYEYNSIAELNEEWEDYKPTEPLIKDEKIRKAVKAWAEANSILKAEYGCEDVDVVFDENEHCLTWIDTSIQFNEITGLENLGHGKKYTIAELCGEEEAPEPLEPTFIDLDERIKEKEEEC